LINPHAGTSKKLLAIPHPSSPSSGYTSVTDNGLLTFHDSIRFKV
jgi:hypothetical protein